MKGHSDAYHKAKSHSHKAAKNFKSAAAMKRWMAYGHATGVFEKSPGNTPVKIRGKAHRVMH